MNSLLRRLIPIGLLAIILAILGSGVLAQTTSTETGTPAADSEPTTSATLQPGEVTAGQIADRIAAAWPSVTSYRAVSRLISADATPEAVASPASDVTASTVREVILPDIKRIVITEGGTTTEIVLAGGVLTKRVMADGVEVGAWEVVDPATVADDDPFKRTYETILAPEQPPYSGLSGRQRDRIGTKIGAAEINGRECTGYLFPEVTETGETFEVVIYLDATDLPCRIETRTQAISQTDYYFNEPLTIATPVA
jgi:hypothetical protein